MKVNHENLTRKVAAAQATVSAVLRGRCGRSCMFGVGASILWLGAVATANADNCYTMLIPVFENARTQGSGGGGPGETYATITKHVASL